MYLAATNPATTPGLDELHRFLSPTTIPIVIAAVVFGVVMAVTPRRLKILAFVYGAALAGIFYFHLTKQYLSTALIAGVIAAVVFYPFSRKTA